MKKPPIKDEPKVTVILTRRWIAEVTEAVYATLIDAGRTGDNASIDTMFNIEFGSPVEQMIAKQ